MRTAVLVAVVVASVALPVSAHAQRIAFERTFDAPAGAALDVSTIRGRIEVVAGASGRIVVSGAATVRVGWDVPANALDIARQVAAAPPVEQTGDTVRLHDPTTRDAQRAVTVSYRVEVPADTRVRTASESGATSIQGIAGAVEVRTQSAAIDLANLSGTVEVQTGSGAVRATRIPGPLSVATTSSSFEGSGLGSSLRARTQSGSIDATLDGSGNVDVETGSSAITLRGVHGGLAVRTQSGRVAVQGTPTAAWTATTSSSSVSLEVPAGTGFQLDAESRSGSITLDGVSPVSDVTKHAARGAVAGGGPAVRVRTGSGSIRIQAAGR